MQFSNRPVLIRVQVQTSRLRGAKNRFSKDRSEDNANGLLDQLSSSRDLISGQIYSTTTKLIERASHLYGSELLQLSPQMHSVADSVEAELIKLSNHLENTLDLNGRL